MGRWHIDAREQCVEDSKQKEVEGAALMSLIELLVKLRIKKKKKAVTKWKVRIWVIS